MDSGISPDTEKTYEQLLWVMRRRFRVVESVKAHFGGTLVERVLDPLPPAPLPLDRDVDFRDLLDERDPDAFLAALAHAVLRFEAATVSRLRTHVSVYRDHVDEQILFGSRTAGQEAGRDFLASQVPPGQPRPTELSVPEAVQALFELGFSGLPGERNHFPMLRSRGGCSVHFVRAPHLGAWAEAGADPVFLYCLRCEWVRGALDILAPEVVFHTASALEQGAAFGLEHFYRRGEHAGP